MKHVKIDERLGASQLLGSDVGACASCGRLRLSRDGARKTPETCEGCGDRLEGETRNDATALEIVIAHDLI